MLSFGLKKILILLLFSQIIIYDADLCFADMQEEYIQHLYRGRVFFNQGFYDKAVSEYEAANSLNADSKQALLNQALIYKNTGDYPRAINIYQRLLKISLDKLLYSNLGEIYYLNSQPDHAITAFTKSIKMGSKNGLIYFWIAKAYQDKNDADNAIWAYEQAISLDQKFALAYFDLGIIYQQKKLWQKAQAAFEKAKELDPSLNQIYEYLGLVYLAQDNFDQALTLYKKALAANPENKDIQKQIDIILKKAGSDLSQKLGKRQEDRLSTSLAKIVQASQALDDPMVRVGIGDVKRLRFKSAVDFRINTVNPGESEAYQGLKDILYAIEKNGNSIDIFVENKKVVKFTQDIIIDNDNDAATILIFDVEAGTGNYWASKTDRIYRGKVEIGLNDTIYLSLINIISMEEYLYGVLPSEMPNDWPMEALKAQAVAARSESFRKMGRHKAQGFDFCSEVHCQSYSGAKVETIRTNSAVDDTVGIVATYNGKPIDAVYSNSCGGHTQGNIFGDRTVIDYWQQKQDSLEPTGFYFPISPLELEDWLLSAEIPVFCNNEKFSRRSNFRWMRQYSRKQLEDLINKKISIGDLIEIIILERGPSAHVHAVKIVGSKGDFIIEKELNIRNMFGNLRSGMFNVNVKLNKEEEPEEFIFYGGGWGHGVGMCQVGAATMADQGLLYQEIIKFYFSGIEIEKLY